MTISVVEALINPGKFFQEKMGQEESLMIPALILLVVGAIGMVSAYLVSGVTMRLMPVDVQTYATLIVVIGGASAIIGAFLLWIVFSVIFFVISALMGGKGSFRRTLEFVGYGYIPQAIGAVVSLVIIFTYVSSVVVTPVSDLTMLQSAVQQLTKNPLLQLASLVGVLFVLWSANIWIFGMKYARNLATRDAALAVGIPIVAYIVYMLYTTFGTVGAL